MKYPEYSKERAEALLLQARNDNQQAISDLIELHMGLTFSVANPAMHKYCFLKDDIEASALEALTRAVYYHIVTTNEGVEELSRRVGGWVRKAVAECYRSSNLIRISNYALSKGVRDNTTKVHIDDEDVALDLTGSTSLTVTVLYNLLEYCQDEIDRKIVALRVLGETQEEIASALGITQQTISYRLNRLKEAYNE